MAELRKYRWDDMPRETLNPGLQRRLISGDLVMLAHVYLDKGTEVARHHHHNEQIAYVLEGALQFHSVPTTRRRTPCGPARPS
jgi:quercetin dioxygenase-like cupin family protein